MSESNARPGATDLATEVVPLKAPEGTVDVFNSYTLADARAAAAAAGEGLSTGFRALDAEGLRLRPGKLYVVAGRPGEGKTALLLEVLLRHVETRAGEGRTEGGPAVFVTYEENRQEIYLRLLLRQVAQRRQEEGKPPGAPPRTEAERWLCTGALDPGGIAEEWHAELERAADVVDTYSRAGLLVLVDGDRDGGDVDQLLATLRTAAAARGEPPSLVVVDYYQKIRPPRQLLYSGSRQAQLQEVADLLRRYAKGEERPAFAVPVLVGAQVNREATEKQPELHHIREADDLANDAAGIVTLHLPSTEDGADLAVKVVKNRDGKRGNTLTFRFYGSCGRVQEGDHRRSLTTAAGVVD